MRAMKTGLVALGVALLSSSCGTERATETGTGGAPASTGGTATGGSTLASGGLQQGGTTSFGGVPPATGGQPSGGITPASGGTQQGGMTSTGGARPVTGGQPSGGSAGMTGNCGDLVETDILARWTSGASDDPPASTTLSVLGAGSALWGQAALRAVTNAAFDFWLRYRYPAAADVSTSDELRFAVRGLNTTPIGWQGNFPVVVLRDATSATATYSPTSQHLGTSGATWNAVSVPLRGGPGWQVSGGPLDLTQLVAIEVHADTWDSGFTLDLDAMSFERAGTSCPCPVTCGQHGRCASESYACQCDLGYAGSNCSVCSAGFTAENAACALPADGSASVWPNAFSQANSDAWLMVHHDEIAELRPRVIALNFANPATPTMANDLLRAIIGAFSEASRAQGYRDAQAKPQLVYQLVKLVDLRDGVGGRPAPPSGYPYDNSTLYPAKGNRPPTYDAGNPPAFGSFGYATLFSSTFAHWYDYPDPDDPGQYLDLCTLVDRGEVHELWIIGSGDQPDVGAAEVLETKPNYTAIGNRIEGSAERCAGNGCFDADVPFCGRSLRIGFVNYNRGPGCYVESLSHGLESAMNHQVAPGVSEWFAHFAGFDLDQRYALPFSSWYGLGCPTAPATPCLSYPTPTSARIVEPDLSLTLDPFDAVCGNVHYPPNAQSDYDINNSAVVESSCSDFGRHSGANGTDALAQVSSHLWMLPYGTLAGDCDGPFLVWWWQNMPGYQSRKTFDDGRPMKSVWPFLYY